MTYSCSDWLPIGDPEIPCIRPGGIELTDRALEICGLHTGSRIADIGCGVGGTLGHLERKGYFRTLGLDHANALLSRARSRLQSTRLVCGSGDSTPFKENSFDALFCECVLSLMDDARTAVGEFQRVVRPGGFLVISDIFLQGGPANGHSWKLGPNTLMPVENLVTFLQDMDFSVLHREESGKLLREFVVRMIFAGRPVPDAWKSRPGKGVIEAGGSSISYFLLVARQKGPVN